MTATEILDAILTNWVSVEQMSRIEAEQDIANAEVVKGERVQQVAVAGVTVPCLAYVGEKEVNVCAFNDSDANALLR